MTITKNFIGYKNKGFLHHTNSLIKLLIVVLLSFVAFITKNHIVNLSILFTLVFILFVLVRFSSKSFFVFLSINIFVIVMFWLIFEFNIFNKGFNEVNIVLLINAVSKMAVAIFSGTIFLSTVSQSDLINDLIKIKFSPKAVAVVVIIFNLIPYLLSNLKVSKNALESRTLHKINVFKKMYLMLQLLLINTLVLMKDIDSVFYFQKNQIEKIFKRS